MKTDFMFKGMMVPVFTPFMDDKKHMVNYDLIDKYAHHLKTMGMHGVMVNGMTGEGMTLTMDERKKTAEKWMEVTRKYEMKMLLNIGGMTLSEVYELAEHAEKMKVDAVMIMHDLFYHPRTAEDLLMYIKDIMMHMPTRPVFYYHIPMMTEVYLNMYHFMSMVEKELPMFTGLFWAHDSIDKLMFLKEKMPNFMYIVGMGMTMTGYMSEGFDAISMTAMNLFPEMIKEMYDYMLNYKMDQMMVVKKKFMKRMMDMMRMDMDMDMMTLMKMEMDKMFPMMKMGPLRKPKMTMQKMWMGKM